MGACGRERAAGRRPPRPGKSVWSGSRSRSGRGRVGLAATSGQARGQEGSEPGTSGALPLCGHEGGSRGLRGVPPAWPGRCHHTDVASPLAPACGRRASASGLGFSRSPVPSEGLVKLGHRKFKGPWVGQASNG